MDTGCPRNKLPALLIECGNLAYKNDLEFITSMSNQEMIARSILKAIGSFNKNTLNIHSPAIKDSVPTMASLRIFKDRHSAIIYFTNSNHADLMIKGLNTMSDEKISVQNWDEFRDSTFIMVNNSKVKSIEQVDKNNLKSVLVTAGYK